METLFGVYCTDGVARNGESLAVSALEDMIWQGAEGRPLSISHDIHRFVGWNVITGLYMSHEMSYVVGNSFVPNNKEDKLKLLKLRNGFFLNYMNDASNPYKSDFHNLLHNHKLVRDDAISMYNGVLMYGYGDILTKAIPSLQNMMDNDGLILIHDIIKEFRYLGQGVFAHNKSNFAILFHPYFRRSYSRYNNFNFGFIDLIWEVYNKGNKSVKILLDPDFIGFAPSFKECREYEYWYGPKYNDDIAQIPQGLTHYENDERGKLYNNIKSTEFIWQRKDAGKLYQFEMEEIVDTTLPALPNDDTYGCRYLHALYDFKKGVFNHFDGAIRCYDTELMVKRIETPMDKMGHQASYQKIFRMDGVIPLNLWKSLITQYLCSNEHIYDYFGVQRPSNQEDKGPIINKNNLLQSYVPYPINSGDGIRLLVSYTFDYQDISTTRKFMVVDKATLENNQQSPVAEFATIEVCKALNRVGAHIDLSSDIVYYKTDDFYNGIPCIHHAGDNLEQNINKTLEGIRLLIDAHVKYGDNDRYSFSLSWPIEDKTICISFMGHVIDLHKWLGSFNHIPVEREGIKRWMDEQNKYIHSHGRNSSNPVGCNHIKSDGILFFQRHDIREHVHIQSMEVVENNKVKCSFLIDDNNEYLYNNLMSGNIAYTPRFIVYDAVDLNSGGSYINSKESAIFRETSYKLNCKMMGFNWLLM